MTEIPPRLTVHDLLDARAALSPGRPALRGDGTVWSYAELRRRSLACAAWLRDRGVRRGDRVLVDAPHSPSTVAVLFAAARLGALYVIVSDRLPERRLAEVTADCTPTIRLTGRDEPSPGWIPLTELPSEPSQTAFDGPISVDPVSLIYTSGSTSAPKAVISTHAQVVFAAEAVQDRLGYRPDDAVFSCLPLSFDYGLYQVFLCCLGGAELILASPRDAGPALLARLEAERPTVLPIVPPLAGTLLTLIRRARRAPEGLRLLTSSGAALTPETARRLRAAIPGLSVVGMFGLTECKRVTIGDPDDDLVRPDSVGRPLRDTEIVIVDETGVPVPAGQVGELIVKGRHVMAGYWNAPELTAQRFGRDEFGRPLLFTGDQCRMDADGHLYFVGRRDDLYKRNGFRVSALEVETAALAIPGVRQAAVLPPTATTGPEIVVSGDCAPEEVLRALSLLIEDFKVPDRCRVLTELPLGANGKIDRRALAV